MQGFTYKYGDRPLEGYTIQRAAGRGGFGEVYYALSDSGREVALKVVQGYEAIELRGISQCMNLKSPHLVTIFDVKYNEAGKPFVLMEFVAGPSLRELLDQSPSGLGPQKTAFFLREMAKGLTYLHDRGIVHRDLKPGNVFYEDGYVKIGDYGLSKAMSASRHSGQTITVGTVHYMAPEIGQGTYDRSIDIYALGCMVYEMLTGQTPYLGASPGEILMKHMMNEPDLTNIEEPFATVIRKALAKDPKDRYQTVQEMVEAVFGAAHIQQSVSCFSPESLTMVAGRVAKKVTTGGPGSSGPTMGPGGMGGVEAEADSGPQEWMDRFGQRMQRVEQRLESAGERLGEKMERVAEKVQQKIHGRARQAPPVASPVGDSVMPQEPLLVDPKRDPLGRSHRTLLVATTLVMCAFGTAALSTSSADGPVSLCYGTMAFALSAGAFIGLSLVQSKMVRALLAEPGIVRRLAPGGVAGAFALLLAIPSIMLWSHGPIEPDLRQNGISTAGTIAAALSPLFLLDWLKPMRCDRRQRLLLGHAIGAAVLAAITAAFVSGSVPLAMGVAAATSLAIQVASPFDPFARRGGRSGRPNVQIDITMGPSRAERRAQQRADRHEQRAERRHDRDDPLKQRQAQRQYGWHGQLQAGVWGPGGYRLLPPGVSHLKRIWALVLAAGGLAGFCGLQRFYVGKIWTGLLWLCTGGLFGVGQIIDAIMIATGNFRDKRGMKLVVWTDYNEVGPGVAGWHGPVGPGQSPGPAGQPPQMQQAPQGDQAATAQQGQADDRYTANVGPTATGWQSQALAPRRPTNAVLSAAGALLLVLTVLVGVIGSLVLQFFTMVGAASTGAIKTPWQSLFNGDWMYVLCPAHTVVMGVLALLATVLLILARRQAGGAHIFRGIAGSLGLLASLYILRIAVLPSVYTWRLAYVEMQQHHPEETLQILLKAVDSSVSVMAALLFLASIVVLAWPARQAKESLAVASKGA